MRRIIVFLILSACACTSDPASEASPDGDGDGSPSVEPTMPDAAEAATRALGQSCGCDADCTSGACVWGICMTPATGACSAAGSSDECPAGSRCWNLTGTSTPICWPDCDAAGVSCDGVCDEDGSCAPTDATKGDCSSACAELCPCQAGTCGDGFACIDGDCVPGTGTLPMGQGPGPDCPDLPAMDCTGTKAECAALTTFNPRTTAAYDDYPLNGETTSNQWRSYLRKDFVDLLEYATAKTLCKSAAWDFGNGGPLGLGDMSESNGAIPGTATGDPGHPANTHVNGYDIDLGYFQVGTADNRLRPICAHTNANGTDAYHCTGEPTKLDVYRMALFLGIVYESSRVRVIGVDGKVGPLVEEALGELCAAGWLTEAACNNIILGYEVTNGGNGWFYFHHHHAHISLKRITKPRALTPAGRPTMDEDREPTLKAR